MASLFLVVDATSRLDFDLLTKHRVPGAIPFMGKYRLIDASLSNATYSEVTNVGVFPNGNYRSLSDHIGSGSRYDLDRRRDGIFILPPKVASPVDEEFMSFQRMNEHDEYFLRSEQTYVIITPATLVWSADLNLLLESHIQSGKDISQVVNNGNERLFTFILSKEKLMSYILNYDEVTYRNIVEVFDHSESETKNTIIFNGYAKYLRHLIDYYNISMKIIKNVSLRKVFQEIPRIRTKDPLNSATYYGEKASVMNSFISSGAFIDGKVENCIVSRRVKIMEGAVVKNSIIMNTVTIEEGAKVENAILDKETIVKAGSTVIGDESDPFVSEKRQIVFSASTPKVAILTAECSPYVKRGGLADMVGSLGVMLAKVGAKVKVFLPLYRIIKKQYLESLEKGDEIVMDIDGKTYHINTYHIFNSGVTYVFIDLYMFFDRDQVYGFEDDPYRFAYYTKSVLEYLKERNDSPDIFHLNDWHTALLPLFMKKYDIFNNSKTLLTIHNLNYQGITSKEILTHFNLNYYVSGNTINILEAGINTADKITTVSKTYAEELKYTFYSGDLQDTIIHRQADIYGIINGLDSKFNPSDDLEIKAQYDIDNVYSMKPINKKFLCDLCGFDYNENTFVIGTVSRINDQKGFDLIIDSLDEILKDPDVKFVLLGVGDHNLMEELKLYEKKYPQQVKCFLDYYGTKPEYIYAGADVFLMPSKIEPCGTSQMIALKYGTIPIVRQTGGLNDTIDSFDNTTSLGNGFKFYNYDVRDLIYTIRIALVTYLTNKEGWRSLIHNAMSSNNSFERCAKEYLNLYNLIKIKGDE